MVGNKNTICWTQYRSNGSRYVVCKGGTKVKNPREYGLKATDPKLKVGNVRTGYKVTMVKKHGGYGKHKEWRKVKK